MYGKNVIRFTQIFKQNICGFIEFVFSMTIQWMILF